jgi:hypothetical protein
MTNIDLSKATSFLPEDKEKIFAAVKAMEEDGTGGFHSFNTKVLNHLRRWVIDAARQMVSTESGEADTAEHLQSMVRVAYILSRQGYRAESKSLFDKGMEGLSRMYGEDHLITLDAVSIQADMQLDIGMGHDPEKWYSQVLKARQDKLGLEHPATVDAECGLAMSLAHKGGQDKLERSKAMLMDIYMKRLFMKNPATGVPSPTPSPDALDAMHKLAFVGYKLVKDHQGGKASDYEEIKKFAEQAYGYRRAVLGAEHPDTLTTYLLIGCVLFDLGKHVEAKTVYEAVLRGREEKLGLSHQLTIEAIGKVMEVYIQQQDETAVTHYYQLMMDRMGKQYGFGWSASSLDPANFHKLARNPVKRQQIKIMLDKLLGGFKGILKDDDITIVAIVNIVKCLTSLEAVESNPAMYPPTLMTSNHPHSLKQVHRPYAGKFQAHKCDLCTQWAFGYMYTCEACDFDCHPFCAEIVTPR